MRARGIVVLALLTGCLLPDKRYRPGVAADSASTGGRAPIEMVDPTPSSIGGMDAPQGSAGGAAVGGEGGAGTVESRAGAGGMAGSTPPAAPRCGDDTQREHDGCGPHGECIAMAKERRCRCESGYEASASGCTNIDECAKDNGGCERKCIDTDSGRDCACPGGFKRPDNTSCWEWQKPLAVETTDQGDALEPCVGMDSAGNAIALWRQSSGETGQVWANRYSAQAASWGREGSINAGNMAPPSDPQLTVDAEGRAIAIWEAANGVVWNRFQGSWQASASWLVQPSKDAGPQLGGGSEGGAWLLDFVEPSSLMIFRFDGSAWSTEPTYIQLGFEGSVSMPFVLAPHLGVGHGGGSGVVWTQSEQNNMLSVWVDAAGADRPVRLSDVGAVNVATPRIAWSSRTGMAIWTQGSGDKRELLARKALFDDWHESMRVSDSAMPDRSPAIVADAHENALAIWLQLDQGRTCLMARRFDAGSGMWQGTWNVSQEAPGDASEPVLVMNADGIALLVWTATSADMPTHVFTNRADPTGRWGSATRLDEGEHAGASVPDVVINAAGNGVALWQQSDGTRVNLVAKRFD